MKTRRNRRARQTRKQKAGSLMHYSQAPANPYPPKTLEARIFDQIVSWFYYSRGKFPSNYANNTGAVPLSRLLNTKTMKALAAANPDIDFRAKVIEVLEDAFEIMPSGNNVKIRGMSWPHTSIRNMTTI